MSFLIISGWAGKIFVVNVREAEMKKENKIERCRKRRS